VVQDEKRQRKRNLRKGNETKRCRETVLVELNNKIILCRSFFFVAKKTSYPRGNVDLSRETTGKLCKRGNFITLSCKQKARNSPQRIPFMQQPLP